MKRKTDQYIIPVKKKKKKRKTYDILPTHPVIGGTIGLGYEDLAIRLAKEKIVILDGYIGVDWEEVISSIVSALQNMGCSVLTHDINTCLKPEKDIENMVEPFLGGDDPIFGFRTNLTLQDYFDQEKINNIKFEGDADISIVYGTGSSQSKLRGGLVYFDMPKNELQFRMRAKKVYNLGVGTAKSDKQIYKHFYFVDWVILNEEKKRLLPKISWIVDQQRPGEPTWMEGSALRKSLSKMSRSFFRVRPWFEPGIWGGQWMKEHFEGLSPDVPNYAWSFEMIVPENGLLFEDNGFLLEVSFDMLMFQENTNVIGKAARRFKYEFPIRFDFLDTFQGGNLSVQCHPKPEYIKKEFGENFTQDETYYILDAGPGAEVYLGFQEGIDPVEFRSALEHAYETKEVLDIEKYVMKLPAKKHDLFLIPHGTVHCSGINNMVLEISATPYIFTFKMYDWQRLDLEGRPRPLNIEHAFKNLDFSRQGNVVQESLVAEPEITESGKSWKKVHLSTHEDHFYDIYRYEFDDDIIVENLDQCHILMLVEGSSIELELEDISQEFHYAETFAIPAATMSYKLINKGGTTAKVIVSFVKDEAC
jgi:mannose-6-phosphate isomerase class I